MGELLNACRSLVYRWFRGKNECVESLIALDCVLSLALPSRPIAAFDRAASIYWQKLNPFSQSIRINQYATAYSWTSISTTQLLLSNLRLALLTGDAVDSSRIIASPVTATLRRRMSIACGQYAVGWITRKTVCLRCLVECIIMCQFIYRFEMGKN